MKFTKAHLERILNHYNLFIPEGERVKLQYSQTEPKPTELTSTSLERDENESSGFKSVSETKTVDCYEISVEIEFGDTLIKEFASVHEGGLSAEEVEDRWVLSFLQQMVGLSILGGNQQAKEHWDRMQK